MSWFGKLNYTGEVMPSAGRTIDEVNGGFIARSQVMVQRHGCFLGVECWSLTGILWPAAVALSLTDKLKLAISLA